MIPLEIKLLLIVLYVQNVAKKILLRVYYNLRLRLVLY